MTIKICIASNGNKKSTDKTRFVIWIGEDGQSKKETQICLNIITNALEEKGFSWEITTGFECA